jgi:hypothetical protein
VSSYGRVVVVLSRDYRVIIALPLSFILMSYLQIHKMVISGGAYKPDVLKSSEVVSMLLDDAEMEVKCTFAIYPFIVLLSYDTLSSLVLRNISICPVVRERQQEKRLLEAKRMASRNQKKQTHVPAILGNLAGSQSLDSMAGVVVRHGSVMDDLETDVAAQVVSEEDFDASLADTFAQGIDNDDVSAYSFGLTTDFSALEDPSTSFQDLGDDTMNDSAHFNESDAELD